mgnify:CR=1 FL=1|jgi:hypothetical protein
MFPPEYLRQTSLLNGKEKLMGNLEVAGLIENMAFECIKNDVELYDAQEQIKTALLNKYGAEWYERNGEAVNYIIENKYCDKERVRNPLFDKEQYDFDATHKVLY